MFALDEEHADSARVSDSVVLKCFSERDDNSNSKMALVIYIKPGCPYCRRARDYYNDNNIAFTEYDAQTNRERRREMFAFSGGDPTVPCIVENGQYIQSGWGEPPRG